MEHLVTTTTLCRAWRGLQGRGFVGRVVLREGLFPRPPRRGLGILGRAVLEEVGVLDAVEDGVQPGQRVLGGAVDRLQAELGEAAVGDVADEGLKDRKSVGRGKSVSVRVAHGGRGVLKKKT